MILIICAFCLFISLRQSWPVYETRRVSYLRREEVLTSAVVVYALSCDWVLWDSSANPGWSVPDTCVYWLSSTAYQEK